MALVREGSALRIFLGSSSVESELFGAILAAKEGVFLRELLIDLGREMNKPTRIRLFGF